MHKPSFLSSLDNVRITDLEDGFQYACAQSCGADLLLTINIKDFKEMEHQALPIMTPMEFLGSQLQQYSRSQQRFKPTSGANIRRLPKTV